MFRTLVTASVFAASAVASSTTAQAADVMRCNVKTETGIYKPIIRVVMQGRIEDIRMGEQGLSRTMFYRDREVLKFVQAKLAMASGQMPRRVNSVCGAVEQDAFREESDFSEPEEVVEAGEGDREPPVEDTDEPLL